MEDKARVLEDYMVDKVTVLEDAMVDSFRGETQRVVCLL